MTHSEHAEVVAALRKLYPELDAVMCEMEMQVQFFQAQTAFIEQLKRERDAYEYAEYRSALFKATGQ